MTALATNAPAPVLPRTARSNGHQPPLVHPIQLAQWTERAAAAPAPEPTTAATRPTAEQAKLDADLARAVRRSGYMRQLFYAAVLATALGGQVSGAVEALDLEWYVAIGPVAALEIGAVVVLNNADVRRRLGERAVASRALSAAIAAGAVVFNWTAHSNHLLGGFFAGMSALGYLVWLMHTENQRRDRLRAKGDLPPTTPAYEVVGHWVRHPWLTLRAKNLAKADPRLGLYGSIAAAKEEIAGERRHAAIGRVLKQEMRRNTDRAAAVLGEVVYDRDRIAKQVAADADYEGLTALVMARLDPRRVVGDSPAQAVRVESTVGPAQPTPALTMTPTPAQPTQGLAAQPMRPTPTMGWAEPGHAPVRLPSPPTDTKVGGSAHRRGPGRGLGVKTDPATPAQPTAGQPKAPAQGASPGRQPSGGAHSPALIPGLTDLQQSRLADLALEFPGDLPGRDKVMEHMKARGYQGWSSKEPARTLINLLRAQRESAQGAQPTAHASEAS